MKEIKVITSVHDCVATHYPKTSQWSVHIIHKLLFKHTLRKSDLIVTVSDYIKNDILNSYKSLISKEKVFANPNGKPDWNLSKDYDENKRERFLFFTGNLEPRKNLLNLIKALEILRNKGLPVDLHIAGPQGWKNREFFHYCRRSRVKGQIHFLGYCNEDELIRNYLTCKAFIYPSLYEGFGLPVLEALCLDSIVLTSKGTVMQEIAGPAALYFNPKDPFDMAKRIESIYTGTFNRSDTLKHKKSILKRFSWEISAQRLLDVMKKIQFNELSE